MDSAVLSQTFSISCNILTTQNAPVFIVRVPKFMISVQGLSHKLSKGPLQEEKLKKQQPVRLYSS